MRVNELEKDEKKKQRQERTDKAAEVKAKVPVFEAETHEHFLFELGSIEQLAGWVDKMDKFMSKHEITTGKDNREYHYYQ